MAEFPQKAHPQPAHQRIMSWLETMVIGLNLCPFAKKPLQNKQIHFRYLDTGKRTTLAQCVQEELVRLDEDASIETTLIVITKGLEDFYRYLTMVDVAEELLIQQDYEGIYQLASFHPDYLFEGEAMDSPSHYTNRSPFPIIHIIREQSIEKVLKTYQDPDTIPQKNIALMETLGVAKLKALLLKSSVETG